MPNGLGLEPDYQHPRVRRDFFFRPPGSGGRRPPETATTTISIRSKTIAWDRMVLSRGLTGTYPSRGNLGTKLLEKTIEAIFDHERNAHE